MLKYGIPRKGNFLSPKLLPTMLRQKCPAIVNYGLKDFFVQTSLNEG